jgi:hypothetical protein
MILWFRISFSHVGMLFSLHQTVPNFYIEIARLTGIFPWCVTIMLGHQVLKHRGFISSDKVVDSKYVVIGRSPSVTVGCLVNVVVLCFDGVAIPTNKLGYPLGFPPYFPPGGLTHFYLTSKGGKHG